MAPGRPDLRWALKIQASAAFCLVGIMAGTGLYFSNLAYIRANKVQAPTVTGVSPTSGTTAGGTTVTITGTNLSGATRVSFGGTAGTITADSSTQITATSPAGSGTATITVTTQGGTSATSSADRFTYVTLAPAVTGVFPASGPPSGGTSVTITGQNLSGATRVSFGGTAGVIIADSIMQITAKSPPGSGTVDLSVTTPGGTSTAGMFTYVVPPSTTYGFSVSGASELSCGVIGSVQSSAGAGVNFSFVNNSRGTVVIDEIGTNGSLYGDATLSPGQQFAGAAYVGLYYVVEKSGGGCLAVFHVTGSGQVTVT